MPENPCCPKCGSEDTVFSKKRGLYVCGDCEHKFSPLETIATDEEREVSGPAVIGQVAGEPPGGGECELAANQELVSPLRIFLSYGHDNNQALVVRIKADLEKRGHDVWFDKDKIKFGHDWRGQITEAVSGSERFLSFLSKYSTRDPGVCLDEIAIAVSAKKGKILTVLVESEKEVSPPSTISHLQWLDMHDWREKQTASPAEWETWYQEKFTQIKNAIESKEIQKFAGEIEMLRLRLDPIDSDTRVFGLLKNEFVGRGWVVEAIEKWQNEWQKSITSRIFWIVGLPGVGKSAFLARLAHYKHNIIAIQFCVYDQNAHRDAHRIVKNLAFQIATRLPDYRERLLKILADTGDLNTKTPAELFEQLLVIPLSTSIDGGREHYLIVIDALDEAGEDGRSPLAQILAQNAERLPIWVGFVITSRPEASITGPFQALNPLVLNTGTEENRNDMREYLRNKLSDVLQSRNDSAVIIDYILTQSDGVFLYAEQVCEEIRRGGLPLNQLDKFPRGLGGLYTQFFARQFPAEDVYAREIRPVLSFIVAAREPLPVAVLQKARGWNNEELNDWIIRFGSLFPKIEENGREVVKAYHKSLIDWLTDKNKALVYFASKETGHSLLADAGWQVYERKPGGLDRYFYRHLILHLAENPDGRWSDILRLLRDPKFMKRKSAECTNYELVDTFAHLFDMMLRTIGNQGVKGNEDLVELIKGLLCYSFEYIEQQELIQEVWFDEAVEIFAKWSKDRECGDEISEVQFMLLKRHNENLRLARVALRVAELNLDYDFLIQTLEYESKQQEASDTSTEKQGDLELEDEDLTDFKRWVVDALFFVAKRNIDEKHWDDFERIIDKLKKSSRNIIFSTDNAGFFARMLSVVQVPFQRKVVVLHAKSILEVVYKILINYPRNAEVLRRLGATVGSMIAQLPVGVLVRIPGLLSLIYSIVQNKWNKVSENAWIKVDDGVDDKKNFEGLFAIHTERQAAIIQNYSDLVLIPDYTRRDKNTTFSALLDLAFQTGLVCSTDEMYPINRAIHGHMLYQMRKFYPDVFIDRYVRPYFLNPDGQDLVENFSEPIREYLSPDASARDNRERVFGLYEMLMRFLVYEAMETDDPATIAELSEALVRYIIDKDIGLFCRDYNIVGRPLHILTAVTIAEARRDSDDGSPGGTTGIINDLIGGRLAPDASDYQRWEGVSKCFFDLFYAGIFHARQVIFSLGSIVDLQAIQSRTTSQDAGLEPAPEEVLELFRMTADDLGDEKKQKAMKKAAGRFAMVMIALKSVSRLDVDNYLNANGISEKVWPQIQRWAFFIEKRYPSPKGQSLNPEKMVDKYYEQMAIGLFTNIVIVSNVELRVLFSHIIGRWLEINSSANQAGTSITKTELLNLLRDLLERLLELLKKYRPL